MNKQDLHIHPEVKHAVASVERSEIEFESRQNRKQLNMNAALTSASLVALEGM